MGEFHDYISVIFLNSQYTPPPSMAPLVEMAQTEATVKSKIP